MADLEVSSPDRGVIVSVPRLLRLLFLAMLVFLSPLEAQTTAPSETEGIVPGRYMVVYSEGAEPADADVRAQTLGMRLVKRHPRLGVDTVEALRPVSHARLASPSLKEDTEVDQSTMELLAAQPGVKYVLHDRIVTAHHVRVQPVSEAVFSVAVGASTFDTYYNSPQGWAVRQVGGYGANIPGGPAHGPWDSTKGAGVRIAILDSGVDASHPDIAPNLALNISEVEPFELPSVCDDGSPQDQDGHGTWTASLAAGALGPGTGKTVGVAPGATLLSIKVLQRMPAASGASDTARCNAGEASGLLSWVIQGIDDAIANHADVISMSLGARIDLSTGDGAGTKALFDQVTYAATQAGAVLIAAAGNDASDLSNPRYIEIPAQSRSVLSVVASTNPACREDIRAGSTCVAGSPSLAYYSNYGASLNALAAPGGSYPAGGDMEVSGWVRGACSSGLAGTSSGLPSDSGHSFGCFNLGHAAYVQAIGTSASAPLVAGAAALLRAAHPAWSPAVIIGTLRSTANPGSIALPYPQTNVAASFTQP